MFYRLFSLLAPSVLLKTSHVAAKYLATAPKQPQSHLWHAWLLHFVQTYAAHGVGEPCEKTFHANLSDCGLHFQSTHQPCINGYRAQEHLRPRHPAIFPTPLSNSDAQPQRTAVASFALQLALAQSMTVQLSNPAAKPETH